jgi:hypothetical protein
MKKLLFFVAAALAAAVLVFVAATLPPKPLRTAHAVDQDVVRRTIVGAYHVHTTVSDGSSSPDDVAAAAAEAGLQFVIFTDHGDGMRAPQPPRYAHGVLCLDAVEISTNGGHYVALDMRRAEYPLGGEASAVVEDVRRLGGFGIAAHPYSKKETLAWKDWNAPVDGLEWLNADSEWRDESAWQLARLPLYYLARSGPALASILDLPPEAVARWDDLAARRPLVALAAHDAHGGIGGDEGAFRVPALPSYEASFRAFALRAIVTSPFTGSATDDARLVIDAVRRGRVFTAVDAIAAPAYLQFSAALDSDTAEMGDSLPFQGAVELVVRASMPPSASLVLICGGREVAQAGQGELRYRPDAATACRPEVRVPGAPGTPAVPWIAGNAIHLLAPMFEPIGTEPLFEIVRQVDDAQWTLEKDAGSQGSISAIDTGRTLQYRLKEGSRASQYAAAAATLDEPLPEFDRILFTAASNRAMRVSVQLRLSGGQRWVRSFYVESDPRRVIVPVEELVPAEHGVAKPDFRQATSILFVVDLTNALPGSSGWFTVSDISFARSLGAAGK